MEEEGAKVDERSAGLLTQSVDVVGRQNPLLYVILVLILGGNGFDVFSSQEIRDEVRDISTLLNSALLRLDEEERLSDRFLDEINELEDELEAADGRMDAIEGRILRIEMGLED